MPTLDGNDATTCEAKVTLEETSAALNKMKNGWDNNRVYEILLERRLGL